MIKRSLIIAFLSFFLVSPIVLASSHGGHNAADKIKVAKKEMKKAKKVGGLWTQVGPAIKKAEKALKAGDKKTAIKLAEKAILQARAGQQQSKDQANAGPRFYK